MGLTFIRPCIANIFTEYNHQDATFLNVFISVRRCTRFRRVFLPSSGTQNCTYSVRYWSDEYLTLYVQFWAPDDGRENRLKHVERLTEINKLWIVASCLLYAANEWSFISVVLSALMAWKTKNFTFSVHWWRSRLPHKIAFILIHKLYPYTQHPSSTTVFLIRRVAARYRTLASVIPGHEMFSWNLSF